MAVAAFIFLITFISVYIEILAGSMGIILPLTSLSVFYLSITYGWKRGIIISIIAGTSIDMLYGRSFIITPYCMIMIVAVSMIWLHKGDPVSILPNLIPGALAAFLVSFPLLATIAYYNETYLHSFFLLVFSIMSGAFMLPVIIPILDFLAEKQGLALYKKARAKALDRR